MSLRKKLFTKAMEKENQHSIDFHHSKKKKLFSKVSGKVLEIGPGCGVNLQYLQKCTYTGVEPNKGKNSFLLKKAKQLNMKIKLYDSPFEQLQFPDNHFDYVISTFVLCSVEKPSLVLQEILRTLKPGGSFIFMEHVVDRDNFFRRCIQHLLVFSPWIFLSHGCHPNRDLGGTIKAEGFQKVHYSYYLQKGKGIIDWFSEPHIYGVAQKKK